MLVGTRRRLLALTALALAGSAPARADIPVVELTGVVHAISAGHVVAALDRAAASGAPLVVLRLDTPGGLDTSMRQIIDAMLVSKVPVAVFVGPAPGTNIGAAHPVSGMGGQMDEVMAKKVTSDAAAYIRGKAERRGRNVDLAEKAVVESKSFTEREALEGHLIDLIVNDVPALIAAVDGREVTRFDGSKVTLHVAGQPLTVVRMNWRQGILAAVASPEILFLLLLGALAGIGAELSHPGMLFPGIVGVFCLILFLFAAQIIPVNWAGVLLILLAVGLFAAEAKVHSYGLLTVSGLAAMILGALMLVDSPFQEMRVPLRTLIPAALLMGGGTIALVSLVIQARRRRPVTGDMALMGQHGVADTDLAPEGWVRVFGERWRALAEAPVASGEKVTVTAVDGLTLKVRKGA
ncbi:MAG: serine protease [Acidobacteria bacterium]|nr:MAG: serine protease [Acidobacteriota bacterium]